MKATQPQKASLKTINKVNPDKDFQQINYPKIESLVEAGDLEKIKEQLELGVNPNWQKNNPLLYLALNHYEKKGDDYFPIIKLLLEYGADPKGRYYSYGCRRDTIETCMEVAVKICISKRNAELLSLFFSYEVDPNQKYHDVYDGRRATHEKDWYLIHTTVQYPEITRVLLEAGAQVDCMRYDCFSSDTSVVKQDTALEIACSEEVIETVQVLLFYQADPNIEQRNDDQFSTPLHRAIKRKNKELVKLLVSFGAYTDIDYIDNGKYIPVVDLCEGDQELISALKAAPFKLDVNSYKFLPRNLKELMFVWLLTLNKLQLHLPTEITFQIFSAMLVKKERKERVLRTAKKKPFQIRKGK
eukprot:TRINITY_DN7649_c1_g2_i1.p1 TRINITY_DN7649_c1_g2~~TRINITY_DN7649_c1_g2_i1.p1  ORF type:complete len:357 (+),score=101.77 TRINITY_DN7649_c1_g2_i1:17-1087(+)